MKNTIILDRVCLEKGGRKILKEISFSVKSGSIHGLLGPNGAGKTSTLNLIAGLDKVSLGHIEIFDSAISQVQETDRIGFLLEYPTLYEEMLVKEYLEYLAKIRGIETQKISEHIEYCVEALDLKDVLNRSIENLSKGFKQRIGIAQAIVHKPDLVILDEPTVGLDPQAVVEMRNFILRLKGEHTVLLSSHLLHEMSLVCDEVTIISEGKIVASGEIEKLEERIQEITHVELEVMNHDDDLIDLIENFEGIELVKTDVRANSLLLLLSLTSAYELRPKLIEVLVEKKYDVLKLSKKQHSLEDIFMKVTEKDD
ncbi:MAG: ABC transporter ATP-binding protein [Bacteriovoracaceae bacterium]|jgi:ABC-2 type transport system ATP-binding protein|nr:hypothetical protein [Halobacteriovoraceae bacterium]MDP7321628.1 ABC transporter ATP-binding protein [Bacteriovoracaceae bacterium]